MNRRKWMLPGAALAIAGGLFGLWLIQGPDAIDRNLDGLEGNIKRGAYVARLSGCIACHTNIKEGGAVLAGGAAIETEFGRFYAPNITPDQDDGIGKWALEDFSRALTAGQSPKDDHYFPSFPYAFYSRLTNQDIVDLWAAVQSVPAVAGKAPEHDLVFPFGFRAGAAAWQRLFLTQGESPPDPTRDELWNRGRYLAQGPAHCGACHTPRNLLGARDQDQLYEGGLGPKNAKVPAITPEALEKGGWTKKNLSYALRTGLLPDGDAFGGAMAEVVRDGTRFWSNRDLEALATFLFDPGQTEAHR